MVCRHVNYFIKICLVIKMTLTRNQRKFSWTNRCQHSQVVHIHELFNFTTKNDKNIDSSKEGSDCDYAAVSSQENRQQISLRSNRYVCLT